MPHLLGILQYRGERALRIMVWPHTLQELCPWTTMGCCETAHSSNSAPFFHIMPMVQLVIISSSLQRKPQVSTKELLSPLDG